MEVLDKSLRALFKPLVDHLQDPEITEIFVNGPEEIWIERRGLRIRADGRFSEKGLMVAAQHLARSLGGEVGGSRTHFVGRLSDETEVSLVLSPLSARGTVLVFRRVEAQEVSLDELEARRVLGSGVRELLFRAMARGAGLLIASPEAAWRSLFIRSMVAAVEPGQRVVVVDQGREWKGAHPTTVILQGSGPGGEIMDVALLLKPDLLVMEDLDGAAEGFLGASRSLRGWLGGVQGRSGLEALMALESRCLESDKAPSTRLLRSRITMAVTLVVTLGPSGDLPWRVQRVCHVCAPNDEGGFSLKDIFQTAGSEERPTGYWPYGLEPEEELPPVRETRVTRPVEARVAKEAKAVEPAKPVRVTRPVEPVREVKAAEPVRVTRPVEPVREVKAAEPVRVTRPVEPVRVTQPVEPVRAEPPQEAVDAATLEALNMLDALDDLEPSLGEEVPAEPDRAVAEVKETPLAKEAKPLEVDQILAEESLPKAKASEPRLSSEVSDVMAAVRDILGRERPRAGSRSRGVRRLREEAEPAVKAPEAKEEPKMEIRPRGEAKAELRRSAKVAPQEARPAPRQEMAEALDDDLEDLDIGDSTLSGSPELLAAMALMSRKEMEEESKEDRGEPTGSVEAPWHEALDDDEPPRFQVDKPTRLIASASELAAQADRLAAQREVPSPVRREEQASADSMVEDIMDAIEGLDLQDEGMGEDGGISGILGGRDEDEEYEDDGDYRGMGEATREYSSRGARAAHRAGQGYKSEDVQTKVYQDQNLEEAVRGVYEQRRSTRLYEEEEIDPEDLVEEAEELEGRRGERGERTMISTYPRDPRGRRK